MKVSLLPASALLMLLTWNVSAESDFAYKKQIDRHPEALEIIEAREMKLLLDPNKVGYSPEIGLHKIWDKVKAFAESNNLTIQEKPYNFDGLTYSTKVYYDTVDKQLAKQGYLVRITTKYLQGQPASSALTVKYLDRNHPERVFGAMLDEEDAALEENVGPAHNYQLDTYLEKSLKVDADPSSLPSTFGEFAELAPLLSELSIAHDIELIGTGVYSIRMKPGYVVLPGLPFPSGISMEAWLPIDSGEQALIYDFSFGYPTGDYYDMESTHIAAESFMQKLYQHVDTTLGLKDNPKWRGSKASFLRNSGLEIPPFKNLKASDLRFYKAPKPLPDGTVAFNDDPS
ncbi:hypothetical protein [Ferrimonas aestuarii]|uniref:Uncharacterized protein n=1 Tax=Ferrimonas aestuarii TaxID=2569539 RepID=A0A4U1BEZ2_9GAMM|nr:hypothetical protein [Ferrimonas aestuarii]TKB49660.1 hypothetical protein FCL42_20150 [Ferrimonas aestuarii]